MAISFVGSAENSAINGSDVVLTLPAMAQGDLVLIAYSIGDNDAVDQNMAMVTAGYTEIADLFVSSGATQQDINLGVYGKFMGATPDSSATVDGLGGADAAVAAVAIVLRGCDTAQLPTVDANNTVATGIDTMHPNPPSITGAVANDWTVIAGASAHVLGGAGTYTFPTGYTTNAIDRGSDDTSDTTVGMGYKTNPGSPEDPGVMTHSGTDAATACWAATTMIIRPLTSQQFNQALDVLSTFTATLTDIEQYMRALAVASTFTASLVATRIFLKALDVASTFVVGVARLPNKVLAVSSTLAIGLQKTAGKTLAAVSTFVLSAQKVMNKTLGIASVFTPVLVAGKLLNRLLEATSAFTPVLTAGKFLTRLLAVASTFAPVQGTAMTLRRALAATSSFLAGFATTYIPYVGGPAGEPVRDPQATLVVVQAEARLVRAEGKAVLGN